MAVALATLLKVFLAPLIQGFWFTIVKLPPRGYK